MVGLSWSLYMFDIIFDFWLVLMQVKSEKYLRKSVYDEWIILWYSYPMEGI